MTVSFLVRCAKCLRQYASVARVICLCGAITVAPIVHSIINHGEVDSAPKASVALSTATSSGNVTMYYGDPVTMEQRQGPGPAFHSMLAEVPGEHEPVLLTVVPGDPEGTFRPLLWTTDDGFDNA